MNEKLKEVLSYVAIIVAVILIRTYLFTPVIVKGISMEQTFHNGDFLLLNKIGYTLNGVERFDVVAIKYGDTHIIKRIIALPGEYIEYKDNVLYINDQKQEDKYSSKITTDIPRTLVAENTYYVLGDNRTDSIDSRRLGLIKSKNIIGKTLFRLYPFNKLGAV